MKKKQFSALLVLSAFVVGIGAVRQFHEIIWNAKSFSDDLQIHPLKVRFDDQLIINCPKQEKEKDYTFSKLYMVSRDGWKHCLLHKPKWVGVCNNSSVDTTVKITIREHTPTPNGFEFQLGEEYYLISTSSGYKDDLDGQVGGICHYNHMRLRILVLQREFYQPTTKDYYSNFDEYRPYRNIIIYQIHDVGALVSDDTSSNINILALTAVVLLFLAG
ncbi:unnamed protein product [Caenorhabditis sp. 36 PRJEB53466]|nr:unnamed protein product [Caenorhabditis sp. 36 PRJEB53466]